MIGPGSNMERRERAGPTVCLALPLALLTAPAGDAVVTVVDSQGLPLPGAVVTLRDVDGAAGATQLSDAAGTVRAMLPCRGRYELRVTLPGYSTVIEQGIDACAMDPGGLTVRMLEEFCECIRIGPCGRGVVDLSRTRVGAVFSAGFLQDLPGAGGHDPPFDCRCPKKKKRKRNGLSDG